MQGVLSKVRGQKEEDDEESRDQRMMLRTEGTGVCSRRPWDWSPGALSLGSRWVPLHTWQEALAGALESGRHTGSTFKIQTQTGKGQGMLPRLAGNLGPLLCEQEAPQFHLELQGLALSVALPLPGWGPGRMVCPPTGG